MQMCRGYRSIYGRFLYSNGLLGSIVHFDRIDDAFALIFNEAFNPKAVEGGLIGAMLQGFQRRSSQMRQGFGSAAIAHSPSKVKYPY